VSSGIGLLALQGDYEAHRKALRAVGVPDSAIVEVRRYADLAPIKALIIPGGESTVMGMLLARFGMLEPLRQRSAEGLPIFATCAGLILLAKTIEGSDQTRLGVLDVVVRRNAYGRQVDSFHAPVQTMIQEVGTIEGIFIRAPRILACGPTVKTLATYRDEPVLVQQGMIVAGTFHPELLAGAPLHRWFLRTFTDALFADGEEPAVELLNAGRSKVHSTQLKNPH